ncbi:3-hydroxybutyrate dehydrogenase [Leisingera sp. D0M16]|uniref:3-hydroxybutyrate dehydrogenase n=1 Tax=Leisingera coralii TaxID=3351347 RepID=UPI003B775A43
MSTKAAIVTGSTSGIGLAIAETLASTGCNILLNGFGDRDEIQAIQDSISSRHGVDVKYCGADMSVPDDISAMVAMCQSKFGSVDILVNNAGIQHTASVEDFPADRWDMIMAINLSSNFHAIRAVLPLMKANGFGRIVNVASVHGLVGSVNKSAYVAAKHGVIGLTKVVALENARTPVTCNAVCPGWVLTPLVQKQIDDVAAEHGISEQEAIEKMLGEKQPSQNFVTPEQIGSTVAFLCSDAASEIRGSAINVDGGWIAQ